jgi:transposase
MRKFYLGIDASKGYSDFIILNQNKQPMMENIQLDDTFEGHCRLYEMLDGFLEDHPESMLYTGVESTGGYENNWYRSLLEFQGSLNLQSTRLNPLGVYHNSKAALKRNVTDKISAVNIAEYMIAHPEKISYEQQDSLAGLRKQWGFVNMLTKQSTQLLNQLESMIYAANPEILQYCKDSPSTWVLTLLSKYPTAVNLARAKVVSVSQIPYISSERAQELVISAKQSVASATDKITQQLIVATVKQIQHLKKTIKNQIDILIKECSSPEVDLLKTFSGISDYSAIGLLLEIQSVKRFPTVKKLAAFFGLHPELKISGDGASAFRMSKKGRKEPRKILYMVALTAINRNPLIRDTYQARVEKGMKKMAAIGLCMHKILRIIYGMLKNNQPFDPDIDKKNREKACHQGEPITTDKNRRYQDYDPKAPISRRQHVKRMERKQSHSDNGTKSGIRVPVPALHNK